MKIRFPPEWGVNPVPIEVKTLRFIDYLVLWSSLGVGLLVFLAGSLLYPSLSIIEALIVSLIGSIIGSVLLASAGVIGSRYGIPTMVSLRAVLGVKGSYFPTCLNVIQLIGWTSFELIIMSKAAASIFGGFMGKLTEPALIFIFALFCSLLALGGPIAVVRQWLEKIAIWLIYGSTIWITIQVFSKPEALINFLKPGTGELTWPLALDLVIAMPISWWPLISDFNRFSIKDKDAFVGTALGYTIANTWFYFLGAAIIAFTGITDIISSISILFLGTLALILILVDETDNAFADIYSAAVSLQNIFPKVKQRKLILFIVGISIFIALTTPLTRYEYFLLMIGALFIPLLGVLFSEFFIIKKGKYKIEEFYDKAEKLNVKAVSSWIFGILTYFILVNFYPWVGASLPSFFVAAIFNYVFSRINMGR
ncbi:MAG: putative hydroxymethylpyrimidine transporter CytX [Candidatus Bathyarchaeia archaeon]